MTFTLPKLPERESYAPDLRAYIRSGFTVFHQRDCDGRKPDWSHRLNVTLGLRHSSTVEEWGGL